MSDFLGTGVSALLAYRRALDTAGHNIANVNTPGYSRQRVELTARPGEPAGNGFIGNGVSSPTVQRLTDALLMTREIGDTASNARLSQFHALASQLDQSLSDADSSLAAPLDNFFNSFNTLAADPSSVAARQSLLGAAQTLASRFNQLDARMDTLNNEVEARLAAGVAELNQRAAQLATLNQRIALASGEAGGQPPNDLLDARDALARSLASQLGISTVVQADGQMNVFTGSGQALVLGNEAYALGTLKTPGQPMSLTYGSGAAAVDLTAQLGGGALGGLLDFRRELLAPAQLALGTLAQDLSAAVNAHHAQGVDADGNTGGLLFNDLSAVAAQDAAGAISLVLNNPRGLAMAQPPSAANSTDNRNALALARLATSALSSGDAAAASYRRLVTDVGTQTQGAEQSKTASASLLAATQEERAGISGVNLDEEAADLVRFQQAYQAAAQVIRVADTVFQSLLDAARR